jgi:hypothetical protein
MPEPVKESIARTNPRVTYVSRFGGIGVGYLIDGKVYRSGGNGWYYAEDVQTYNEDNGEGYRNAIRSM